MNKKLYWLAASCIVFLCTTASCRNMQNQQSPHGVWMKTEPIQCLGNPWEKAWLEAHRGAYDEYPNGHPRRVEEEEKRIIRDFFESQGIHVLKVEAVPFPDDAMVCEACDCPQGYTLYILTDKEGAEKLEQFGFREGKIKEADNE